MKRFFAIFLCILMLFALTATACAAESGSDTGGGTDTHAARIEHTKTPVRAQVADMVYRYLNPDKRYPAAMNAGKEQKMTLKIGDAEVPVTWENNASVEALGKLLPLTIDMSMYGGFEQVGSIGRSVARNDSQMSTNPGDIVLYSGDQIVVFYGTNSWSYTKLGHVDLSADEMTKLLSQGDVTITISK